MLPASLKKVKVKLKKRTYDILIQKGIIKNIVESISKLPRLDKKILIISNPLIADLYLEEILQALKKAGYDVHSYNIKEGEAQKNLDNVKLIYDHACKVKLERKSSLIALGGGVIGDITGFVAATYLRGINFLQIPTTLLAQVDSSIGGKTGVNLVWGKNLVGSFYQPRLVLIDPDTLKSLPNNEFSAGMAEIIKYAMIWDKKLFLKLASNDYLIEELIQRSCQIKAEVVRKDELETDLRMILNFGHTFGHVIEKYFNYQSFNHGQAVAMGMIFASLLACELGLFSLQEKDALIKLCKDNNLPTSFPKIDPNEAIEIMTHDKKTDNGKLTFILPQKIGKVLIKKDLDLAIVKKVLQSL